MFQKLHESIKLPIFANNANIGDFYGREKNKKTKEDQKKYRKYL